MELVKIAGAKSKLALAGLLAGGLFAAWAGSAGAASVPAVPAEPQAQIDATESGCTAVLTNTRLLRVRRNSFGFMTARLFEQTWVDRCPDGNGGTVDRNQRRVQLWQDW